MKKLQYIKFLLFLSVIMMIISVVMFVLYANTYKASKIFNENRIVSATAVDVEKTNMATVPISYSYKPYTLVFEFKDSDGTVYRATDRKYDTEELARSHLGEIKKIRIDGQGNFIDGSIKNVQPNGFLIAGIVLVVAAILSLLLGTLLSNLTSRIFSSFLNFITGENRPVASIIIFLILILLLGVGSGFFASGLNGINNINERREFIENAKTVEATFVCMVDDRNLPSRENIKTLLGWTFKYEYIDHENDDLEYTGYDDFIPVSSTLQEIIESHNEHVGAKVKILIDGQGNCMLASSAAENPIDNAYLLVGIMIYSVDLGLLIAYLIVRFKKNAER